MTAQELLDELRGNLLRDKSDAVGGAVDQLWSDDTLLRYLDDAYRRFARRTLCLSDNSTAAVTQIALSSGVAAYTTDVRVLMVLSAILDGRDYPLKPATHDGLAGSETASTGMGHRFNIMPPGEPRYFATDEADRTIRVYPAPSDEFDGTNLLLRVCRLPLLPIDANNLSAELEMVEDYHLDLAEWAAYRALRNHDADAENLAKAEQHKSRFEDAIAEAKSDARKRKFSPTQFNFNTRW